VSSALLPDTPNPVDAFVPRFGVATRLAHWALAIAFLLLLLTGLTNYWPALKAIEIGGGRLFGWLHVILGFAMVGVSALALSSLLTSRPLRADARALARATVDDYSWLQHEALRLSGARSVAPPVGKFNAGQKLNAYASFFGTAALLGTGVVLGVNYLDKRVLGADLVSEVFPWHTLLAFAMIPIVLGHIYLALIHPSTREALRGITRGVVRRDWARRHHPAWRPEDDATA
jgi:formate dehydrogenase subunit gamma